MEDFGKELLGLLCLVFGALFALCAIVAPAAGSLDSTSIQASVVCGLVAIGLFAVSRKSAE